MVAARASWRSKSRSVSSIERGPAAAAESSQTRCSVCEPRSLRNVGFGARPAGQLVVQRAVAGGPKCFGVGEQRAEFGEDLT